MIYLVLVPIYIIACIIALIIMFKTHKSTRKKGRNPWIGNIIITVITFFIVTGDWLPSEIYYHYQCKQLPSMQVYKTPKQWITENQDLIKGRNVEFKINNKKDLPQLSEDRVSAYLFVHR